jgi:predicted nucleic acid-binding protein
VILIDSSVWIDAINRRSTEQTEKLGKIAIDGKLTVGDLILAEVLQGLREEARFVAAQKILGQFQMVSLCGPGIAVKAAANYRLMRQRGITVRGTIDVIIATWCIENGVPILHNDRDMAAMEEHLGLVAYA